MQNSGSQRVLAIWGLFGRAWRSAGGVHEREFIREGVCLGKGGTLIMAVLALTRRGEEKLLASPQESPSVLAEEGQHRNDDDDDDDVFQSFHNSANDRSLAPRFAFFLPFTQPF